MYKIITLAICVAILAACVAGPETEDLSGAWSSEDMSAVVEGNELSIFWDDGETRALYWKGDIPESIISGDPFVSAGDTDAMDNSLLGSLDDRKAFIYENGELSFDLTVMGVTQTITMTKDA